MIRMSTEDNFLSSVEAENKKKSERMLMEDLFKENMNFFQERFLERFFIVDRLIREERTLDLLKYVNGATNPVANLSGDPVLHVVIACGKSELACRLIENMQNPLERLADIKNKITGDTALHVAASRGNEMVAMKLLETDHRLLQMRNKRKEMPLHKACFYGQRRMFYLLVEKSEANIDVLLERTWDGNTALHCAILGNAPDLSLYIAMQYPMLTETRNKEGATPLHLLLAIPEAVRAKQQLKLLDLIIYKLILVDEEEDKLAVEDPEDPKIEPPIWKICVHKSNVGYKYEWIHVIDRHRRPARGKLPRNYAVLCDIFDIVISIWKGLLKILRARCSKIEYLCSLKEKHNGYMKLIAFIARNSSYWEFLQFGGMLQSTYYDEETAKKPSQNFWKWNESPLTRGIKMGIYEFVEQILKVCPASSFVLDLDNHNILQVAIEKGQERIVDLIESLAHADNPVLPSSWLSSVVNRDGSNMGHFAANPTVDTKDTSALQLQTELRWFKRVERMLPAELRYGRNRDGHTARELFSMNHKNMLERAQKDLKKTGAAFAQFLCSLLVAAVVFASSFSISGDKANGRQLYMETVAFKVFSHAFAIGLSSASTALMLCLSFATSQCSEEDFESYIPTKYIFVTLSFIMTLVALLVALLCNIYLNVYWGEVDTGHAILFVCEVLVLPTVFLLYLVNRKGTASWGITKYLLKS